MATLKYRDKDGTIKKISIPDGSTIVVDTELSETSENPVQNKIVTVELEKKIETLDDDSQGPDAVNFDLDQTLSLTSTKGVQNKVIAQEFQKYAAKTEIVAVEDVEVEFNSELFSHSTYYCKCIGKMCFLYFTAAFKKSGAISHLTSLISIKNSKYYAITDYNASRLFIGTFGGSNDLNGKLVMYDKSTIKVQSDTNNVLETEAMRGSIQWMIK